MMEITVLVEDNSAPAGFFKGEHGFSLYIEHHDHRYLIDTGQSALFTQNAILLNKELRLVDFVIITHGHYDHINGLPFFLNVNEKARIILSGNIPELDLIKWKDGLMVNTGMNFVIDPSQSDRFIFVENKYTLPDNVFIIRNLIQKYSQPKANVLLRQKKGGTDIPDDFSHEIIPCFITGEEVTVFTGCAHAGILNIMDTVLQKFPNKRISNVIGGFHLPGSSPGYEFETGDETDQIASQLAQKFRGTHFYTGHCTGKQALRRMQDYSGLLLSPLYTGLSLIV